MSNRPEPSAPAAGPWRVEHLRGSAQELHAMDLPAERCVRVLEVTAAAWVLGSTQPEHTVDVDALGAAGVQLARRRSGGGAVLLVPGEHVWIDVVVPAGDPLAADDVEAATWWLGAAWAAALAPTITHGSGADAVSVHRRGVSDRQLGPLVCFAAAGPGEVSVGERKLVGISQRRTRDAARFQCVLHRRFDADSTWSLVAPALRSPALRAALDDHVTDLARLGVDPGWSVVEDLLAHLG